MCHPVSRLAVQLARNLGPRDRLASDLVYTADVHQGIRLRLPRPSALLFVVPVSGWEDVTTPVALLGNTCSQFLMN